MTKDCTTMNLHQVRELVKLLEPQLKFLDRDTRLSYRHLRRSIPWYVVITRGSGLLGIRCDKCDETDVLSVSESDHCPECGHTNKWKSGCGW